METNNVFGSLSDDLRESGKNYQEWVDNLANLFDKAGNNLAVYSTAFRFIAENIGTEFEFPAPEFNERKFRCQVHAYPKEDDPTKWTLKIEITYRDEEAE